MKELLELLKDGRARTINLLAIELNTSIEDVSRKMEYLENMGIIKKVKFSSKGCSSCNSCSKEINKEGHTCKSCLPEDGFKNMGNMWEVME
ncbi:FeoC like transcriptional regulator [Acetitomaculum ruminis DSM 5522]|uniref:FeoC like transcriptional regulator n=1 Tax=Acetitomaculum ruminis DSM 5522 TaxID=1120918 RepID=A0A1I0XIS7_9FIRM|nr:helix-turn-helix domain-containing protein [Acetitomaculum ruminis]SFB00326.1 FeoC like transcriptional regulator [Acetitomaculum ruminis DSM 5522]